MDTVTAPTPDAARPRFLERVLYASDDGRISEDIAALLPEQPSVNLDGVALLLANPSIDLEFIPCSLWKGIELRRSVDPWPSEPLTHMAEIAEHFEATLTELIGDAATVSVAFSAGLDSLAVLFQADQICKRTDRRLVALMVDLVDDVGVPCAAVGRTVMEALGIDAELVVVADDDLSPYPIAWSPIGPRYDAMPLLTRRMSDEAAARGAQTVLTGSGADELFMCSRFTGRTLVAAGRFRDAMRYLGDMAVYDGAKGVVGELLGIVSPLFPPRHSFSLFLGLMWPGIQNVDRAGVLAARYAERAHAFYASWLETEFRRAAADDNSWSRMAARCSVYPRAHLTSPTDIPFVSPFVDGSLSWFVHGIALPTRFERRFATPYQRLKAPVIRLFPPSVWGSLPRRKQFFEAAIARYTARSAHEPTLCEELGLLSHRWRAAVQQDERLGYTLDAVETWLRGAAEAGASFE